MIAYQHNGLRTQGGSHRSQLSPHQWLILNQTLRLKYHTHIYDLVAPLSPCSSQSGRGLSVCFVVFLPFLFIFSSSIFYSSSDFFAFRYHFIPSSTAILLLRSHILFLHLSLYFPTVSRQYYLFRPTNLAPKGIKPRNIKKHRCKQRLGLRLVPAGEWLPSRRPYVYVHLFTPVTFPRFMKRYFWAVCIPSVSLRSSFMFFTFSLVLTTVVCSFSRSILSAGWGPSFATTFFFGVGE